MDREPAVIISTLTAAATAILALLVAYGFDVSDQQQQAILGVVAVAAPIIAGIVTRSSVWAPASVEAVKQDAYRAGLDDATDPATGSAQKPYAHTKPSTGVRRQTNVGRA